MIEKLAPKLSAEEASRIIIADIRAYPHNGPDKCAEHIRDYGDLVAPEEIKALWAERKKLAQPKVVGF